MVLVVVRTDYKYRQAKYYNLSEKHYFWRQDLNKRKQVLRKKETTSPRYIAKDYIEYYL